MIITLSILLHITKAQTSFQINPKFFQKVATKFERNIFWNFLLTDIPA